MRRSSHRFQRSETGEFRGSYFSRHARCASCARARGGQALKNRVMEPTTQYQFISMVETPERARLKVPAAADGPERAEADPDPSPEVTHKSLLPVENARPKVAGGGAPTNPHNGNGSGHALAGNGEDDEDRHPPFRSSRRIPR